MGMGEHQKHGRGAEVWLTPPDLIAALGPFDLDPCFGSPRPWSTAAIHYGPDDPPAGGLSKPWIGFVWCNPPYDAHWPEWLERCADHGEALALIFARTETAAFHRVVFNRADALFFLRGRIWFRRSDGRRARHNAGAPSVLVAYGREASACLRMAKISGQFVDLRRSRQTL